MQEFSRSMLLPYLAADVFQVVNDVEKYSEYLPGVKRSEIVSSDGTKHMVSMRLEAKGISETLVTSNAFDESTNITISLINGPFDHLRAHWTFHALEDLGCRVQLAVEFELKGQLLRILLRPLYKTIVDQLMRAFHNRVQELLETV